VRSLDLLDKRPLLANTMKPNAANSS